MDLKKILRKKEKGSVFLIEVCGFFLTIFIMAIVLIVHTYFVLNNDGQEAQNALVISNMSIYNSPNLDLNTLSENPQGKYIGIKDPEAALGTWEEHLKYNLNLDQSYTSINSKSFIKSKVDIKDFIIYNVSASSNTVTVYTLNPSTMLFDENIYPIGNVKDPKGRNIKVSCVYSNIGFTVNTIGKYTKYVTVNKEDGAYEKN